MSRLEQLRKLAALAPNDPMTHYGIGIECLGLGQWDDAVAAFSDALRADEKYSAAYYHKARAEIALGRQADAGATLTQGMATAHAQGDWKTENEMQGLLETI